MQTGIPVFLVYEDSASFYSASEIAREEFPDKDITVRGAVSIGRRLMDPLAEMVKIDPKSIGVKIKELIGIEKLVAKIHPLEYVSETFGKYTVEDDLKGLKKPGLDPRSEAQLFEFAQIYIVEDVKPGMVIPCIITNLTRFGAFVDIGVKQDGLVHISEIESLHY